MYRAICLVVVVCSAGALANPASQIPCQEVTQCEVSNVDITPCAHKDKCLIKIGKNATINFDFVPEFSAKELLTDVSWHDIPFQGLESDACKSTACPVAAGVKQSFSYYLPLRKSNTAKGVFVIKWKVWNKAVESQLCCFQTTIQLK